MKERLDFLFLLASYNRFDYLIQVIDKIIKQSQSLNIKIGIVNDFSNDERYDELIKLYGDILIYEKNEKNYGKDGYYLTVNKLLEIANKNNANTYIFLADDSLPSKNLIKYIDFYTKNGAKVINIAIHQETLYTNWGLNNWVDGGFAITHDTYLKINQKLEKIVRVGYGTGVFREITLRLNKLNIRVHFPKYSLLYHMGHTMSVMHTEIRKKEQIHSYSFIDNTETDNILRYESIELLNQKIHISISDAVMNFKDKMVEKYNLKDYVDNKSPTIFFGMYNENDYKKYLNHFGQKIIIWCGTDSLNAKKNKHWWGELKKGVNISMSSFIYKSLDFCGIHSYIVPICPTKSILNVKPKGNNIYWYYNSINRRDFYGGQIIDKIKKLTSYNIIEAKLDSFDNNQLSEIYESCFLGLRLTDHDGLPNTVVELGLMGRYCLHNGETPNSINYNPNDINDIIKKIDEQFKIKEFVDYDISKKVHNYISFGDNLNKLFFSFDAVVDNKKIKIISDNEIFRNKQYPNEINKLKIKKLSIIIPTYKNTQFLPECFDSILKSIKDLDCEILVGIDSCQETLKYVKNNRFDSRFKFYFFEKNLGPYVIKNTLSTISSSDKLLFFDSDDIMLEDMTPEVMYSLDNFKMYKPMYFDFKDKNEIKNTNNLRTNKFGEGVFAINKETFLEFNGFEGWRCAADSDFMARFYKKNLKFNYGKTSTFLRRVHPNSLTTHPETNLHSKLRAHYFNLSKKKNNKLICDTLMTSSFVEVKINTIDGHNTKFEELKNKSKVLLNSILGNASVKTEVNYEKINEVISRKGVYDIKSSIKPVRENLPNNRNELMEKKKGINSESLNKILPGKPNRRNNLPNIQSYRKKF